MAIKYLNIFLLLILGNKAYTQFAPAAGQPGSSAIYKDSTVFIDWANQCNVVRGWQNSANTSAGYVSAGDSTMALGIAGSNSVVSLGDGGKAICTFSLPVVDAAGYDFAVFENSFSDNFLELAFVEISSDGINFFRFPATSLTQDTLQIGPFDTIMNPELLNNLAGKYRVFYGTPFDLNEMTGIVGLDVMNITHIKIVDVVGSIDNMYATFDQYGKKINEHWPTEFFTGGFDLEAIGIIHNTVNNGIDEIDNSSLKGLSCEIYPNPAHDKLFLKHNYDNLDFQIFDIYGNEIISSTIFSNTITIDYLTSGIYLLKISGKSKSLIQQFVKD